MLSVRITATVQSDLWDHPRVVWLDWVHPITGSPGHIRRELEHGSDWEDSDNWIAQATAAVVSSIDAGGEPGGKELVLDYRHWR